MYNSNYTKEMNSKEEIVQLEIVIALFSSNFQYFNPFRPLFQKL
jgi:hypothetical protein